MEEEPITPPIKQGNSKSLTVALIIILSLVIIGLVGYIILDKTIWSKQGTGSGSEQSQTDISDETTVAEITEGDIKDELAKESSDVLNISFDGRKNSNYNWTTIFAHSMYNYLDELMTNGNLSEKGKLYTVLYTMFYNDEAFSKITTGDYTISEARELVKNTTLDGYPDALFDGKSYKIDADTVAKAYKELFGEDLKHQNADEFCGGFAYEPKKGVYIKGLYDACGGASPISFSVYREKYETSGDKAYVYLRFATINCDDYASAACKYYGDYYDYDAVAGATALGSVKTNDYFDKDGTANPIITNDNLEQFAAYRMVFEKQDDGNYAFEKIEKL